MNHRNWLPVAELLGIAAVVASLIFVGLEIQQSREIARGEWTGILSQEQIAIESLMMEQPEVWRRGCVGDDLSPTERTIFVRQFNAFYHLAFARWLRGNIGINGADPQWVSKEYAKNLHRYSGLGELWIVWKKSRVTGQFLETQGLTDFPDVIDSWLPVLAEEEPNPEFAVEMCGVWTPSNANGPR
jgi:hypothetical protein